MDIKCFPHTLHIGEGFSFYFIVLTSFSPLNDLLGFFLDVTALVFKVHFFFCSIFRQLHCFIFVSCALFSICSFFELTLFFDNQFFFSVAAFLFQHISILHVHVFCFHPTFSLAFSFISCFNSSIV